MPASGLVEGSFPPGWKFRLYGRQGGPPPTPVCGLNGGTFELVARSSGCLKQLRLTRIPKLKTDAARRHGERTPLACGFRRLAENLVRPTCSRGKGTINGDEGLGGPPKPARGPRALPIPTSEAGAPANKTVQGLAAGALVWLAFAAARRASIARMQVLASRLSSSP